MKSVSELSEGNRGHYWALRFPGQATWSAIEWLVTDNGVPSREQILTAWRRDKRIPTSIAPCIMQYLDERKGGRPSTPAGDHPALFSYRKQQAKKMNDQILVCFVDEYVRDFKDSDDPVGSAIKEFKTRINKLPSEKTLRAYYNKSRRRFKEDGLLGDRWDSHAPSEQEFDAMVARYEHFCGN